MENMKHIPKYILFLLLLMVFRPFISDAQIIQAEYFWDTDPGQGSATQMSAYDGNFNNALESVIKSSVSLPAVGMHTLNIRVKAADGNWGPLFKQIFSVENLIQNNGALKITQAELFFDADPGEGNATQMLAFDGNFNNAIESVIKSGVSLPAVGMHTLNIRVKAADGNWGPLFTEVFSVENLIQNNGALKITQAELFFDADPGEGNATQMLAFDGNFNNALESVIKSGVSLPAVGMHTLNIRVKAADGNWGPLFTEVFSVENLIQNNGALKITQAELFFDADPGLGNATQMLAFDGNFNNALESVIKSGVSLPVIGMHTLNIRVKAADGNWGPLFTEVFSVENLIQNNGALKITQAELFWDTDPGEGNGTAMLALDGNFSDAMETVMNNYQTNALSLGPHALYVRIKASDGNWGTKFGTVVNMDTSLVPVVTGINGTDVFCSNDNLNNISYSVIAVTGDTYLWSIIGGTIVSGGTSSTVTVNWNSGAPTHEISIVQTNGYGSSVPVSKSITILSASFAYASNDTTVCAGTNITLTAGGGTSYQWSSGQTTASINVAPTVNFMYYVTVSNGTCSDVDTVIVSVISLPAAPVAGNNGPVEIDSTLTLTASTITGASYLWTGPNGFTSTQQNPTVSSSATLAMAGTYNVTANVNGCDGPAGSTVVIVGNIPPAPTAGNNGPVCEGSTLSLIASTITGATYSWTGPNGFTSTQQNPTVSSSATTAMAGTYNVTATVNGFTSPAGSTVVVVNLVPSAPTAGNNGPVNVGSTLSLTASTITGASYNWTGPNSFTSTQQNPTVSSSATLVMAGTYYVTATVNGCTGPAGSTEVIVNNPTGIDAYTENATVAFWPNPFGSSATIAIDLHESTFVNIEMYDIIGQYITTIENAKRPAGKLTYNVDKEKLGLASGTYLIKVKTNETVSLLKVLVQ